MKLRSFINRQLTIETHRISNLPIVVLMPHSRCNCRCVMCDIWKANSVKKEISAEELSRHLGYFKKLGVKEVVLSGGEPLMHANLWKLCEMLRQQGIRVTLLSTGLLLEKNASSIVQYCDEVIISIDGSEAVHDKIRNIPNGFQKLTSGIQALKTIRPDYKVTGRSVIQRYNYEDFINTVHAVKNIGISAISFLPADVSSSAFNHTRDLSQERVHEIALSATEAIAFEKIVHDSFVTLSREYETKFIAESPGKMQRVVDYYKAINGITQYSGPQCNAPWVSVVIESDGRVMPCFFHKPYGNIYDGDLVDIINSDSAIKFRRDLNIEENPVCSKCVCALKLGRTEML